MCSCGIYYITQRHVARWSSSGSVCTACGSPQGYSPEEIHLSKHWFKQAMYWLFCRGQSSQSEWTCPRRPGGHCPAAKTSLCFKPPCSSLFSSMGSASLKWERENKQEQLPLPTEQQLLCVQCTQLCRTWQTFIFVATVVITGSAVGRPSI